MLNQGKVCHCEQIDKLVGIPEQGTSKIGSSILLQFYMVKVLHINVFHLSIPLGELDLFPSVKRVHGERSIGRNKDAKETSKSEMIQKMRYEKRLQSCEEYNIKSHPPHRISVLYHKIKLFTCIVPKAGSTFWRPILEQKIGGTTIGRNPNLKPWDRYVSTVFGRHPLLRLYSAYNDKYLGMTDRVLKYVGNFVNTHIRKHVNRHPCYEDVTLEEFAKVVIYDIKHHLYKANHHWRNTE